MNSNVEIVTPITEEQVNTLKAGDRVLLSGVIYTARDAAHKRLVSQINKSERLSIDLQGQIIYYVGPTPARPGVAIGAAGPTTSYRMDPYAPLLMKNGLKGMIGKGIRSQEVKQAMQIYRAVYFVAIGGAGALMSKSVLAAEVVAFPDLGTEAIRRLEIDKLPVIVANDVHGGDLYEQGVQKYSKISAA